MKKLKGRKRIYVRDLQICLVIAALFLPFYVFLHCQLINIGYQMREKQQLYNELLTVNRNYKVKFHLLHSPDGVKDLMSKHDLELQFPSKWSCVAFREKQMFRSKLSFGREKAEAGTR